jgi:hypothetical protein
MRQEMRELYIEGLAIRGGLESCVVVREGGVEALTGVRAGWAIEPRNVNSVWGADALITAEGNIAGDAIRESPGDPARSVNLGTYGSFMRENREVRCSPVLQFGAGREGKAEAVSP